MQVMIRLEFRGWKDVFECLWLLLVTLLRKSVTPDGAYWEDTALSSKKSA